MSDTAMDKTTAEGVMKLLQSLLPTKELMEQATTSFSGENYDESDEKLVNSAKRVIDLERGLGPEPGISWDWVEGNFGVAVANAVGFAKHIQSLINNASEEDEDRKLKMIKLIKRLIEAAFAHAPKAVKAHMDNMMETMGDSTSILFLWAMFNCGVMQGLVAGWRCHEVAIVNAITPADDSEKV